MHQRFKIATFAIIFAILLACQPPMSEAALDAGLLDGLSARVLGPAAVSGRITAIDVVSSNPRHIVIGAASGGVWISTNGGLTWTAVFDDQPVASIGSIAINQSNPDIIWVGTGEGNTRNSTSIGGGMFKSIDGGKSWKLVGLEKTERISLKLPTLLRWARFGVKTRSAASLKPPMAARRGSVFCTSIKRPAALTSSLTRSTRTNFTPVCGNSAAGLIFSSPGALDRAPIFPGTAAIAGSV
jgi:hypothetical protein